MGVLHSCSCLRNNSNTASSFSASLRFVFLAIVILLVDFQHSIEAPNQSTPTTIYTFDHWSDGGAQTHTITVPATAAAYTATFTEAPNTTPFQIGETTVFNEFDCCNGNLLLVQDAVLSQPGTLQSLSFYVTQAVGDLRLGIYDSTGPGGGPGAKRAETNAFTPVVGWNTVNVITPVALSPDTYWLAYLPQSDGLEFRANRSIGTFMYYSYPFGPMPATFSTSPSTGVTRWSFYGTLLPIPPVPAATAWGLLVMGLSLMSIATHLLRSRRPKA